MSGLRYNIHMHGFKRVDDSNI